MKMSQITVETGLKDHQKHWKGEMSNCFDSEQEMGKGKRIELKKEYI